MKKIIALTVVLMMVASLFGCKPIEDLNGENDKSLATITDERLAGSISGSISMGSSRKSGSPSTQRYENSGGFSDSEYDYDNIEYSFKSLNGTQKAMITYLKAGETMFVTFSSDISSGNFAAVLISPDKRILRKFEADEDSTFSFTADTTGDYLLVIAGESCAGSLEIYRTY